MIRNLIFYLLFFSLAINAISQITIENSDLKEALNHTQNANERIDILLSLTDLYINNTPDTALVYALEAYNISIEKDLSKKQAGSLNRLARIYWLKNDLTNALDYSSGAFTIATENNYSDELVEALINTGYIFLSLGDKNKSSEYFFNSLKLGEEIDNKKLISKSLNCIGYLYFSQQNIDKALEYYLSSLSIARDINDKNGMSAAINNVAAVYGEKGELEDLKTYVLEAVDINKDIGQLHYLAINYMNLSFYYIQNENSDSAIYYNNKALEIARKMNNPDLAANIKSNMARFLFWSGQIDESLAEAQSVLEEAQANDIKKVIHAMASLIDEIYMLKNDYKSAYPYSKLKFEMKDSLNLDDKLTEISKLELLYKFEKDEQKQRIKEQRKEFIFYIIGIILISLLGFLLSILRRNKMKAKISELEKQKLEDQLEFKNKELTANVMSLMKKNEMLSNFSIQLMEIQKEAVKDETRSSIKKISKELKKSMESGIWDDFELRFKEVHTDFYNKLMEEYPNLSPNEQRLSAFLRLNMSTKEISELTGQSINAIEMARFRLRKKLDISGTDENLITFLSQI